MIVACTVCGCTHAHGASAHAIASALAGDDLDQAIELGLLEIAPCPGCDNACRDRTATAAAVRRSALAARSERSRATRSQATRASAVATWSVGRPFV